MLASVEPVELLWTVIILSALFPAAMNLILQVQELHALRVRDINGGAQFVARGLVIVESVVMSIVLSCLYIGIVAMIDKPDPNAVKPTPTLLRSSIIWALLYVGVAIVIRSWAVFVVHRYRPVHAVAIVATSDNVEALMEQLHDDNVLMAEKLVEADEVVVRKVKPVNGGENGN